MSLEVKKKKKITKTETDGCDRATCHSHVNISSNFFKLLKNKKLIYDLKY